MNIIIPMAGMGKRMRPHTLTVPKPLIPVAGKPIVQRLVEDIANVIDEPINKIAFIIGDFGSKIEQELKQIAYDLGAEAKIFHQKEALGTAHAILCAEECLEGPTVVAFADTLFKADFTLNSKEEGIIWVQKVEDPKAFGVVKLDNSGHINEFIEKPQQFVSDLAIIGIYYFRDGGYLKKELQYLIDNDIKDKGEYQLTNALENMKNKGTKFIPGKVEEWLDCGNKDATVYTNQRMLEIKSANLKISDSAQIINSTVIQPCYIGRDVKIENAVVGPHVSISEGSTITNSVVKNSIIQKDSEVENAVVENSMIGSHAKLSGKVFNLSVGDYNTIL